MSRRYFQAEAETPAKAPYGRVSLYLAGDLSADGSFPSASTVSGAADTELLQAGTVLLQTCSSGRGPPPLNYG